MVWLDMARGLLFVPLGLDPSVVHIHIFQQRGSGLGPWALMVNCLSLNSKLQHLGAAESKTSYSDHLGFIFLLCKMKVTLIPNSVGCYQNQTRYNGGNVRSSAFGINTKN